MAQLGLFALCLCFIISETLVHGFIPKGALDRRSPYRSFTCKLHVKRTEKEARRGPSKTPRANKKGQLNEQKSTEQKIIPRSLSRPSTLANKNEPALAIEELGEVLPDLETIAPLNSVPTTAYKALLCVIALIYGSNFVTLKYLDSIQLDVSIITAIRFFLASVALAPFLFKQSLEVLLAGLEIGLWVSIGYITQAIGLETTQASKSAFICSLSVVVVPLINGLFGRTIRREVWVASLLAVVGVGLLTLQDAAGGVVIGDVWSLGQPLGFGIAFVRTERFMSKYKNKALAVSAGQMISVFLCASLWTVHESGFRMPDLTPLEDWPHVAALLYTGLITSALMVVLEAVALAYVPVEEATVILSTEPLWATAICAAILGERLSGRGITGIAIIMSAVVLTQLNNLGILKGEEESIKEE